MATRKAAKKKTFALKQFQVVTVGEVPAGAGANVTKVTAGLREYVTVDTGLTWTEAQEARRKDQSLIIVPEARVYKKRASRAKKAVENSVEATGES
jgi:hypothetical protein